MSHVEEITVHGREIVIDRHDLNSKLNDVGEYLAELAYIDLALAHIEERNRQRSFELLRRPAHTEYYSIQLGKQFPFSEQVLVEFPAILNGPPELELLTPLAAQASEWASNEMAYLNYRIREIMHYPVHGYTLMDGHIESVWSILNGTSEDFGYLQGNLASWQGTAADEFKSKFYFKYERVREHQMQLVNTLRGALEASRRCIEYSQQGVINVVTGAREALLEQLEQRSNKGGDSSPKVALLILAGALTVAATVTAGQSLWLAAGFATAGFSAGVAAQELPEAAEPYPIEGRSAEELQVSLLDAIREVDGFLIHYLDDLHDHLRDTRGNVDALRSVHEILPRRPALADGVGGAEFHHESSEQYP